MKEPEVDVLKPEEISDQEMADLCEEEVDKQDLGFQSMRNTQTHENICSENISGVVGIEF